MGERQQQASATWEWLESRMWKIPRKRNLYFKICISHLCQFNINKLCSVENLILHVYPRDEIATESPGGVGGGLAGDSKATELNNKMRDDEMKKKNCRRRSIWEGKSMANIILIFLFLLSSLSDFPTAEEHDEKAFFSGRTNKEGN